VGVDDELPANGSINETGQTPLPGKDIPQQFADALSDPDTISETIIESAEAQEKPRFQEEDKVRIVRKRVDGTEYFQSGWRIERIVDKEKCIVFHDTLKLRKGVYLKDLAEWNPLIKIDEVSLRGLGESPDPIKRKRNVVAITDIHGDVEAFGVALVRAGYIHIHETNGMWILTEKGAEGHIVLTGDLLDRGSRNREVLDRILELKKQNAHLDILAGNHEMFMLDALMHPGGDSEYSWFTNGGNKVIEEIYGKKMTDKEFDVSEAMSTVASLFLGDGEYAEIFEDMKLMTQIDDVLYVHAGVNELAAKILQATGVAGVNAEFYRLFLRKELHEFRRGDLSGVVWMRKGGEHLLTPEIAAMLKERGINAIVHGHTATRSGKQEAHDDYGVLDINGETGKRDGFVEILTDGSIKGKSWKAA